MNASVRDWRLWFLDGPAPDHEYGADDADTGVDRQWWRASHSGDDAGPPYWVVDQRVLGGRVLEDALRNPSEVSDLLGFLPRRLMSPLENDASEDLPPGLRRLGPGHNGPTAEVAAGGAVAMVLVDGAPVIALQWRVDDHIVVGFAWDGRLVAAMRPHGAVDSQDSPGVSLTYRY